MILVINARTPHGLMVKGASDYNLTPRFNYLVGYRFYQTKIILNVAHLIFFHVDKIAFNIFCFDTRYDQRVSGFILCEDS